MQLQSLPTSLYSRAVSPSTHGKRSEDHTEAELNTSTNSRVKDKSVPATERAAVNPQQQPASNEQVSATLTSIGGRLTHEDIVQQQQSAAQFTPTRTTEGDNKEQNKRRDDVTQRQKPLSYSLVSYTGQRANLTYLDVAGSKAGRVVDELV